MKNLKSILTIIITLIILFSLTFMTNVFGGVTDYEYGDSNPNITRVTTTTYFTTVQLEGTLFIEETEETLQFNLQSEELAGNVEDTAVANTITDFKNQFNSWATQNGATEIPEIEGSITDYYYNAHDEITQSGNTVGNNTTGSDVILVGDINDIDHAYTSQGPITINTILEKHQTYKMTINATKEDKDLKKATITLKAPKVGDTVGKETVNDGYGEYTAQTLFPTVTTTTKGININAFWVKGLEELSYEQFFGTFEENTYYYALIDIEAQDGYTLNNYFPDGISINGSAPAEIFPVYGGKWTHCVAKIKATTTEIEEPEDENTYEFLEGKNLNYVFNEGGSATFRVDADFGLFEDGGAVYVDDMENPIDSKYYKAYSGSTVIELSEEYMNTLEVGEHTLKVAFNNGESAVTNFTIEKESTKSKNPKTGDKIVVWFALISVSLLGIVGTVNYKLKNK